MPTLKILKKRARFLAKELDINKYIFNAALELLKKGKIAAPEKVFRNSLSRLNRNVNYSFLLINMGQKAYFFIGDTFPLGDDLTEKLKRVRKQLSKAKDTEEQETLKQLEFFYTSLEELAPKGFATGTIKFSREYQNKKTDVLEHFMAIKKSSLEVDGTIKTNNIVKHVRDLDYSLVSKRGEVIFLELRKKKRIAAKKQASKTINRSNNSLEIDRIKTRGERLLAQLKLLRSTQTFKGLGLIYKMNKAINKLDHAPTELKGLVKKLDIQQKKFIPIYSKQMNQKLEKSFAKLDSISVIKSSSQLDSIFRVIQKMYAGWQKYLPNQTYSQGFEIEQISKEINIIKEYEQKLIPLRTKLNTIEDVTKKIQLSKQINTLIKEAKIALA